MADTSKNVRRFRIVIDVEVPAGEDADAVCNGIIEAGAEDRILDLGWDYVGVVAKRPRLSSQHGLPLNGPYIGGIRVADIVRGPTQQKGLDHAGD